MILLILQKADLVSEKVNFNIRSVNKTFPWPSVIRLKKYVRAPYNNINLSRKNILRRDNHKCVYCGRGDLAFTLDHVIPKSKFGKDSWENLVTACLPCNNKKGDRSPEEAKMSLKNKPRKPNYIMFILNSVSKIDENWRPFLFQV